MPPAPSARCTSASSSCPTRHRPSPAWCSGTCGLLLSGPTSSAGRPMPDGRQPVPGGWNRFQLVVDDIAGEVARLRAAGLRFRNAIVSGPGGSQILNDDLRATPLSSSSQPVAEIYDNFSAPDGSGGALTK